MGDWHATERPSSTDAIVGAEVNSDCKFLLNRPDRSVTVTFTNCLLNHELIQGCYKYKRTVKLWVYGYALRPKEFPMKVFCDS